MKHDKDIFYTGGFQHTLPQWVKAVYTGTKRSNAKHYFSVNLTRGQVSFHRFQSIKIAVSGVANVRSFYESARAAYKAEYQIQRVISPIQS